MLTGKVIIKAVPGKERAELIFYWEQDGEMTQEESTAMVAVSAAIRLAIQSLQQAHTGHAVEFEDVKSKLAQDIISRLEGK